MAANDDDMESEDEELVLDERAVGGVEAFGLDKHVLRQQQDHRLHTVLKIHQA